MTQQLASSIRVGSPTMPTGPLIGLAFTLALALLGPCVSAGDGADGAAAARTPRPSASPRAAPSPTPSAPLALPPGAVVEIACATQAVLVATGAANATNGEIRLRLERTTDTGQDGRWTPLGEAGAHAASLATLHSATCSKGCPLTIAEDDDLQLWAPAPKGLDKLGADELLTLAVIKSATLQLKASTFRGQAIEALESGACRRDAAEQPAPAQSTAAPAPAAPPQAAPPAPPAAPDTSRPADVVK